MYPSVRNSKERLSTHMNIPNGYYVSEQSDTWYQVYFILMVPNFSPQRLAGREPPGVSLSMAYDCVHHIPRYLFNTYQVVVITHALYTLR